MRLAQRTTVVRERTVLAAEGSVVEPLLMALLSSRARQVVVAEFTPKIIIDGDEPSPESA